MGGSVIEITSKEEWEQRLKGPKPVVVDFYAQWCGPCKMIAKFFESLAADNANMVFLKVDVEGASDVAEALGISAMPTFQVYLAGTKEGELVGASQEKLKALVSKFARGN